MAASKVMADRRLQNILSHLSPPVTSASSDSPHSSRLGQFRGSFGAVEDDVLCQEIECRRPHTDREAKLIENLMLSRLRRFYTHRNAAGSHSELRLVPCRGESKSLHMAEEHVEVETRELENSEPSHGAGDEGNLSKRAEAVRAGITSVSAVSSSGAAKPRGHLTVTVCEFCDIIQGAAPCIKLYEDELCLCILDINPLSFGHSLIIPKTHFPCLEATPPQVAAAMCAAVPLISSALLAATRCDSFNMLVNSGVAAGQVIMHTHFHIIPRCKGDGLWKSESATRKPIGKVQEAKSLAHAVRTKLSSTVGPVTQHGTPLSFNREGLN